MMNSISDIDNRITDISNSKLYLGTLFYLDIGNSNSWYH